MPFDANLVLIDGKIDMNVGDGNTYAPAESTTRLDTSGAAVIDLRGTGVRGLAVVLIIPVLSDTTDYLTATIQTSDEEDFLNAVDHLHEVVKFDAHAETLGVILASECTAGLAVVRRFTTDQRYVRAYLIPTKGTGDGSFSYTKVLLSPYPFNVL